MLFLFALLAFATGCTRGAAQVNVTQLHWSGDTLLATPEMIRAATDSNAPLPLNRPLTVRTVREMYAVSDAGDDAIVLLDRAGRVVRRIGSRGRGPGELRGLSHIAVHSDHVFGGEAYNGRVSEFSLDGAYVRSYSSPFAAGALIAIDSAVLMIARSGDYYATTLLGDETREVFPRRPLRERRWDRMLGHDLIAGTNDRTWILDQASGVLCEFSARGPRPRCAAFPADLATRLRAYRDARVSALEASIRMRVEAAPMAKDMVFKDNRLAILLPLPELAAVVLNVDDGTLTPVVTVPRDVPSWIRSARSFDWDREGFVFAGEDAIARYSIIRAPGSGLQQ